jgi:hypothetical protein
MSQENLVWVLTALRELQRTGFSGQVVLSFFQGQLHGKMKQVIEIKKP